MITHSLLARRLAQTLTLNGGLSFKSSLLVAQLDLLGKGDVERIFLFICPLYLINNSAE